MKKLKKNSHKVNNDFYIMILNIIITNKLMPNNEDISSKTDNNSVHLPLMCHDNGPYGNDRF